MSTQDDLNVILKLLLEGASTDKVVSELERVNKEMADLEKGSKKVTDEVAKQEKATINAMRKEAAAINRLASLRAKELGDLKEKAAWIERGARPLFALGISSFTAITLLAKKYIDSTEESNEITQRWAAASQKVSDAQMRIGKIAAESVLPLYEKLASIAEKTADFVEKHPGVIEGGLKASIVAAGLGGIGLLVTKGITLYADYKMIAVGDMQLAAAKIMSDAASKQLAAATGGKVTGTATGAATTATAAGTAGKAAATGGKAAATAAAGVTAGEAAVLVVLGTIAAKIATVTVDLILQKTGVAGKIKDAQTKIAETSPRAYPGVIPDVRNQQAQVAAFNQELNKLGFGVTDVNGKLVTANATIAQNSALVAAQTQAQTTATQSANENAQANQRLSQSMYLTQRSAEGASSMLSRFPSSLMSLGSSISSFFQRIVSSFTGSRTASKPPVHDYTGYAYTRTYAMAQDGKRQFVMSGDMTRIAEQMLGGQLNQQAVLSALSNGVGSRRTLEVGAINFNGEYTKSMRKAVQRDQFETLKKVIS